MRWFVSRNGKTKGPYDKADIISAVSAGQIGLDDTLCQEGTDEWIPVRDLGAFAAVVPPAAVLEPKTAPISVDVSAAVRSKPPWFAIVSLAVSVVGVGVIAWRLFALDARQLQILEELRDVNQRNIASFNHLRKLTDAPQWFSEKDVLNTCLTNRDTVTCTFTNTKDVPVATCARGLLYQKEASGVRLQALPMCTGRLMPAETKTITATWVAGFADDISNKETAYGKQLDWSKCVFTTEPYDLERALK